MEPWVALTLAAAAVQTMRLALQKRLRALGLSTGGATYARFFVNAPLLAAALAVLWGMGALPGAPAPAFWGWVVAGGTAQVVATFATVALFTRRSFAVGVALAKCEVLLVAAIGAVALGETVSAEAVAALAAGTLGVVLLTPMPRGAPAAPGRPWEAAALGLAAGALYGLSAVGYRGATVALGAGDPALRALVTLAAVTLFQSAGLALWLRWREPGELRRVARAWRATAPVGLAGLVASLLWFTAFAMMSAAYVRGLGQVELLYSVAVSVLVFRERLAPREVAGIALLGASVAALLLLG